MRLFDRYPQEEAKGLIFKESILYFKAQVNDLHPQQHVNMKKLCCLHIRKYHRIPNLKNLSAVVSAEKGLEFWKIVDDLQ